MKARQWFACGRKQTYWTRRGAEVMKERREKKGSMPLRVYKCDHCRKYHLTHAESRPNE